jgi:outer membrane protein OmpA-like peptidoglycan-associated protein
MVMRVAACLLVAATAGAQTPSDSRPSTPTADGDTGLWYVPTAEVLPGGRYAIGGYRIGRNEVEGFSNVADFEATVAAGVGRGIELYAAFKLVTRIDRDLRPIFTTSGKVGGVVPAHPFVTRGWSGNHLGDLIVGAKLNLMTEARQQPVALAARAAIKAPTGDKDAGVGTGKLDALVDVVVSRDASRLVEIAGYGGVALRGKPDGVSSNASAFRWGLGAGFPSRTPFRVTAELSGELPFDDALTLSSPLVGADGSRAPARSSMRRATAATVGLSWQHANGFFLGGGITWDLPRDDRTTFNTDQNLGGICLDRCPVGDFADVQVRVGYHPGVRVYTPPPPPPAPPPPPPVVENRLPTVAARCEPCIVQAGQRTTVTADAQDPDGDTLRYRWTAPSGTFQNPQDRQTTWTAPQQPGPVQLTIAVDDGKGGMATAAVDIQVMPPPPLVELVFEDVFFDFDRSTLRPEALRLLGDAVAKLQANPGRSVIIEGHTCNIGTAEYNLALGERRAESVRAYLASQGIAGTRLEVRSYGEERPKYDNAREETRRLNRRAALVVRVE